MTAKLIKHSKSAVNGKEILTYELTYPRMVHAELMTHRLFSRNAASSRAIPISKLIDLIKEDCAKPVEWGLNQSGMQAKGVHNYPWLCNMAWIGASKLAILSAKVLQKLGLHKQICNRVIEPYQYIKTIVTFTEGDNWFWLRDHKDADPTIQKVAKEMWEDKEVSTPQVLEVGEYHLPYIGTYKCPEYGNTMYHLHDEDLTDVSLEDAIKISTSCCAQVSYRVLDDSLEKALKIYNQLVTMSPVHASPFEHVATPMADPYFEDGHDYTDLSIGEHIDSNGRVWSGNFMGWSQYRQSIPNNTCWDYKGKE